MSDATLPARESFTTGEFLGFCKKPKLSVKRNNLVSGYKAPKDANILIVKSKADINAEIMIDASIPADGYAVTCGTDGVSVRAQNKRGAIFGLDAVAKSVVKFCGQYRLPLFKQTDYPSFAVRGIIEGYYGLPWTDEVRQDVAETIRRCRMNSYWYAPKNDPYHRDKWRALYEGEFWDDLVNMIQYCKAQEVDFYYCISPMLDFNALKEEDYQALFAKTEQVLALGVTNFGLLFDDIEEGLKDELSAQFANAGEMHARIANRLNAYLAEKLQSYTLTICPTEYYDSKITAYKTSLGEGLDPNIKVIWTGYHTIAEVVSEEESKAVKEIYKRDLVLWDNYPVNDFIFDRVFLGALDNRSERLPDTHWAMIMNPMGLWHASKPALLTAAAYMWNPVAYNADDAERRACEESIEGVYAQDLREIVKANAWSVFSNKYLLYFDKILAAGPKIVLKYYKRLTLAANNIAKSKLNPCLAEELESWLDKIKEECGLVERLVAGGGADEEEILECLNGNVQLGTTLFRDFVLRYGYLSKESYENKVMQDEENYYKRLTMRPKYWRV